MYGPNLLPDWPQSPGVRNFVNLEEAKTGMEWTIEHRICPTVVASLMVPNLCQIPNQEHFPNCAPGLRLLLSGQTPGWKVDFLLRWRAFSAQKRVFPALENHKSGFHLLDLEAAYRLWPALTLRASVQPAGSTYLGAPERPIAYQGLQCTLQAEIVRLMLSGDF